MAALTDADLRRWRRCPRRFWLARHDPATLALPAAQAERADAGVVGGPTPTEALLAAHPGARLITPPEATGLTSAERAAALARTATALQAGEPRALVGACFEDAAQGLHLRVDLMRPGPRGWTLVKVRHATVGHERDVDQLALWAATLERQGLPVADRVLALVDTDFVYPGLGLYAGLYRHVDLSAESRLREAHAWAAQMRHTLAGNAPPPLLGEHCRQPAPCAALASCQALCGTPTADAPAADTLALLDRETAQALRAAGWTDLRDVPPHALPQPRQRRIAQALRTGAPVVEPGAPAAWAHLAGPQHFLRFETIGFAVPWWPGTRPYQVLPFQWTCARRDTPGQPLQQQDFLAEAGDPDPRRAFALSLLAALGEHGPVLAYNAGFERNRLRELAAALPDLAPVLEAVQARLVDLFQLTRAHLYHPAMDGSWSARAVLDAVAPELGCGHFEVLGCRSPLAAYARSLARTPAPGEAQTLRTGLREHGARQVQALARLTDLLAGS